MSLSHGNAGPEQGFSINKALLDAHGTLLSEDMIIALRRIKHRIIQVGGVLKFEITKPLLKSVQISRNKYNEELAAKKEMSSKRKREKEEETELTNIEKKIKNVETAIEVAEKAISDGGKKLERHLAATPINPSQLQADNSLIQMGVERRKQLNAEKEDLLNKRSKIMKNTKN